MSNFSSHYPVTGDDAQHGRGREWQWRRCVVTGEWFPAASPSQVSPQSASFRQNGHHNSHPPHLLSLHRCSRRHVSNRPFSLFSSFISSRRNVLLIFSENYFFEDCCVCFPSVFDLLNTLLVVLLLVAAVCPQLSTSWMDDAPPLPHLPAPLLPTETDVVMTNKLSSSPSPLLFAAVAGHKTSLLTLLVAFFPVQGIFAFAFAQTMPNFTIAIPEAPVAGDLLFAHAVYSYTIKGLQVAVYNANRRGGIHNRLISIATMNRTQYGSLYSPTTIGPALQQYLASPEGANTTALFGLVGGANIEAAIPTLENHSLFLFGEASSGVSLTPSRQVLMTRPTTAFEALELIELAVTRKFFRHVAIAASFDDAFREFERRLAQFNYTIASRFVLPIIDNDPSFSYTAQWQALVAGAPNAIIIVGTPSNAAEQLISDCMATAPWTAAGHEAPQLVVASSFLGNITTTVLGKQPNRRAANGATVVVAGRTPSAGDATSPAAALFRREYDSAHAAGATENNVTELLAIPGASPRVFAAWTDAQVMLQALGGIGAHDPRNISREDISPAVLRRVVYTVGEMNFGMYYDRTTDCALCGTSAAVQNPGTDCAPCMCTTGARQLLTEEYSPHSAATTVSVQRVSLLTCNASSKTISHSLAFVNTIAPGGNLSTEAPTTVPMPVLNRVFEPYSMGKHFGASQLPLVQALVPNVTKGYAHAASVRHFLLAMGPLVDLPLATLDADAPTPALRATRDAVVSMLTLQPLPILPRLLPSRFQRHVVSVLPPLEAEMSAVAQHIFARGRADGARSSTVERTAGNIAPAHVISVIADTDGGVADPATNFSTFVSTADLGILPLGPARLVAMGTAFERACGRNLVRVASTVLLPFRLSHAARSSLLTEWLQSTIVTPVDTSVFLAGLTSSPTDGEVPALLTFLQRNPRASVYLPFSTIAMHYEALVATLNTSAAAATNATERVFVASGIPHWAPWEAFGNAQPLPAGVKEESYYGQFLRATSDPGLHNRQRTPLTLLGALMAAYAGALIARIPSNERILPSSVLIEVYESVVVNLDDGFDVMGPFYDVACSTQNELHVRCEQNYPTSRLLRLMPLAVAFGSRRSSTAAGTVDTLAVVADDLYSTQWALPSEEASELLSLRVIIFIAFSCFLILVIAAVLVGCVLRRRVREAKNAPADASRPFTMVFTDIQSSTTLWAELPEIMGPALDFHHMTIRTLLNKHRGYEVKTVGDSFMIAFKSATDAVKFSDELQRVFFVHEWGGDDFDQCIREIEAQFAELREAEGADPSEYAMLTCYLGEAAYRKVWRGLRVRVGIHTGLGEIKLDEVTKAYDYYGTVVNTAARIESCAYGGQVIVSDATRKAVATEMESDKATTTTTQSAKKAAAVTDAYGFGAPSSETSPDTANTQQEQFRYRDLGFASLRGLATPVWLLQLETVPGRNFGPLRDAGKTVLEGDDDDDLKGDADSNGSASETSSCGGTTDSSHNGRVASPEVTSLVIARLVTFVLQTLLSTATPKVRCDMLKAFCKHWRVHVNVNHFSRKQERKKEKLRRRAERQKGAMGIEGGDQTPRTEDGGSTFAGNTNTTAVPEELSLPTLRNLQLQTRRRSSAMDEISINNGAGGVQISVTAAETPRERTKQWTAPYLYAITKKIAGVITAQQRQQTLRTGATNPATAAANADGYEMSLVSASSSKSGAKVSFEGLVACVHDVLCQRTPHHGARGGLGHRLSDMGSSHGGLESVTFASQYIGDSSGAHARRQSNAFGPDRVRNFSHASVSSEGGPLKPPTGTGLRPPLPSSRPSSNTSSPKNGSRGSAVGKFLDQRDDGLGGAGIHIPEVLVPRPLPATTTSTSTGDRARIAAAHGMRSGYDHLPAPTPSIEAAAQRMQRLLVREYRSLLPEAIAAQWERQHRIAKTEAHRQRHADDDDDDGDDNFSSSSSGSGTDGGGLGKAKNRHWTDQIRTQYTNQDHGMRDPWQYQHLPAATASDEEAMAALRAFLGRLLFGSQKRAFLNNQEGSDMPT